MYSRFDFKLRCSYSSKRRRRRQIGIFVLKYGLPSSVLHASTKITRISETTSIGMRLTEVKRFYTNIKISICLQYLVY